MKRMVMTFLVLCLCTCAYALTNEQTKVVGDFSDRIQFMLEEENFDLEGFILKTDSEKTDYITDWVIQRKVELTIRKANLSQYIKDIDDLIIQYDKALQDWGY